MRAIDADAIHYVEVGKGVEIALASDIDKIPTLSPDEVRGVGEWEQKEIINLEDTTIEQVQSAYCSVCGMYHTTPFSYYFTEYNYCPSCGARMKGAEDKS